MAPYKAPFYFNIRFYQASTINKQKNMAHIRYIGTRPGVDRGVEIVPEKNIEPEQMELNLQAPIEEDRYERDIREFAESVVLKNDVDYSLLNPDSAAHHVKYAHERPRSHGLFSSGDAEVDMAEIQSELNNHEGMVWRVIISLHGDDAKRLEMESRQAWEETIRSQMVEVTSKMGIQISNLRWVAAYHPEEGHPHAHIVFWEKKPKRRLGKVNEHTKREMRKVFVKKIYAADRDRYGKMKTEMRNKMRELGIVNLRDSVNFFRSWKEAAKEAEKLHDLVGTENDDLLAPRVEASQSKYLSEKLLELSKSLPNRGRLMFQFMPDEIKKEVLQLAEWLYLQPQFQPVRSQYEKASEILARPYTTKEGQLAAAVSNAHSDMIKRLSQSVLKAASMVGKENHFAVYPEKIAEAIDKIRTTSVKIKSDGIEHLRMSILNGCKSAGFTIEDYYRLTEKSDIPRYLDGYARYRFKNPLTYEKRISKGIYHLLVSQLGDEETEVFLKQRGYSEENLKGLEQYREAIVNETLAESFEVRDPQMKVISTMAKLLYSGNLDSEEVREIIDQWNDRSSSEIPIDKIDKALKAAAKEVSESTDWGLQPVVPKKDFLNLCNSLGIEADYPWRSEKERERLVKGNALSVAEGVFKKVMAQIKTQMKRNEAEVDRAQERSIHRIKVDIERDEKERDRKEKSR